MWHVAQGMFACRPEVIGNQVWLNVAPVQAVVVWHVAQVVGNPAET
jgi:hypothetical protein